ncbi:VOC family protein [Candidatus Poriferisocius sp.]|uniref:VOC family protein n=1 Tax=Candidatus Poriferisocius sp. TaxID=3101276 RepID=UPI003B02E444
MSEHHQIDLVELRASSQDERDRLTEFYAKSFGWKYTDWGELYSDTHDSGLTSGIDVEPKQPNNTLVVIYSNNLDASMKTIIDAGGDITVETYEFPGGKRFHFHDPIGNEVAVWSDK